MSKMRMFGKNMRARSKARAPGKWRTLAASMTAVAALLLGLAPTRALATSANVAATHSYIRANYTLAHTSDVLEATVQYNVNRYTAKIAHECKDAGAGTLENEAAQQLGSEAAGALWSVAYSTAAAPIRAFRRSVEHLHWSNPRLTRIAHAYASSLYALATLPAPNLCGDVRAWQASGFHTIPASTVAFDRHVEAIEGHTIPWRLLAPYELPQDKVLAQRTANLESVLEHDEFEIGFEDWMSLLETLGLPQ
jgi:hypothetical protein